MSLQKLHFEPSAYEIACKEWGAKVRKLVIAMMEDDGIYDKPLKEREGEWGKRYAVVTAIHPKPDYNDFGLASGNCKDHLLHMIHCKD